MKERILSGLLMLPLLVIVFIGGNVLAAGCFIIGVMGVREFFNGFANMGIYPSKPIAYASAVILYAMHISGYYAYVMCWVVFVVAAGLLYLYDVEKRRLEDGVATIVGILYVIFFSYHVALPGTLEGSYGMMIWLVFIIAFGTDIFAYFTGYLIGRHKLCPKISPKKTIEGSVGGFFGSVILCGVFGYFFLDGFSNEIVHFLIMGALGSAAAQLGDLTASVFKRKMGIKDYGNLIPGHGGILDRFDSVLFTAPVIYYYLVALAYQAPSQVYPW